MGEWTKQYPVDFSPTGDTTSQAIEKHINEFDRVYNLLNRVRKLDAGDTPPTDPITYHLWLDTSEGTYKFKLYDGEKWVDFLAEILSSVGGTVTMPTIYGPYGGKYNTTITLSATGSLTAYKDNKAVVDHFEWQLPDGSTTTGDSIDYTMPDSTHVGETLTFKCRAVDNIGNVSSWASFTVDVTDSLPPEINSVDREEVLVGGESYTFTIDASDPEGGSLQYKITCSDSNVTIDPSDWSDSNSFTVTLPDYISDTPVVFTYHVKNASITTTKADFVTIYADLSVLGLIDGGAGLVFKDVAVDSNGNVFVCGYWYNGSDYDFYIVKFDKNLKVLKQITVDGGHGADRLMGIAVDSNDNVFVCGYMNNGVDNDFYIAKLGNDLNFITQIRIESGDNDILTNIAIDSNNNIFVCGYVNNGTDNDFYIAKLDNDLNIVKQITLDSGGDDYLYDIAIDSNGNVFACGSKGYVIKLDNDLNVQKQVYLGDYYTAYDITIDSDNNVLVANRYYASSSDYSLRLTKLDNDLNSIRQQAIDKEPDSFFGLCSLPDGNICMVSMIESNGYVLKTDKFLLGILKQCGINRGDVDVHLTGVCSNSNGDIYVCGYCDFSDYPRSFIAKLADLENYDGTIAYTLNDNVFAKYDADYSLRKTSLTLNDASYSATSQDYVAEGLNLTPVERDFTVYTDVKLH